MPPGGRVFPVITQIERHFRELTMMQLEYLSNLK